MNDWKKLQIGKAISFNPAESIGKGEIAKKVPMGSLTEFQRKINSYEFSNYNSGPKFRNGDTIMAKITPCLENGKTAYVDVLEKDEVAFGSSEYIVLRQTKFTDSLFIYYLAISPTFRKRAISCMEGTSGRKRVSEKTLKLFELDFPSLSIQKQIAKVLSDLDGKIEINNKINQELEAMAKMLYDYWFVQFDFPDANGKPYKSSGGKMVYNEELKREIPEGWKEYYLDEVVEEFTKGITTKYVEKSNLINLNQKVNKGFKLEKQYFKYLNEDIEVPDNKFAFEKDILINSLGQGTLGRVHYYCENTGNVVVDQHLFILRADKKKINATYLYQLLSSGTYQKQIDRQITGSTGMQMLNATNLKTLKFVVPKMNILNEFERIVYPFFKKNASNETESQKLVELRDWLLPMLMNGQVSVGVGYGEIEGLLGMVAEPPKIYGEEKTLADIFPESNLYAEVACLLAIEKEMNRKSRGKTWVQKTANHLKEIKKESILKNVAFEEYYWGMYSTTIAQAIDNNPYLLKENIGNATVYKLRSNKIDEIKQWMEEPRNASFVVSTRSIITLYNNPLIHNDLDKIELLNTVYRCMQKLGTSDFDSIYKSMREWPMQEQGYANKAEKFKPKETRQMIGLIKDLK